MGNWMRADDLMHRMYETLCEYPQGMTAYKMARRMGYSHSHMRVILNRMVELYPAFVGYTEDTHRDMVRKTYFARYGGEIE